MGEGAEGLKTKWDGSTTSVGDNGEDRSYINKKPMRYVSLHHHSTYSFKDGYSLPSSHVRRATQLNMSAMALTEHGNVSSHAKLDSACKVEGVKPIYGCEIYTGATDEEHRTQRKNHLTVLAESQEGYKNLLRMVTRSTEEAYYEPTVSWDNLSTHGSGLIVLSGCTGSLLSTSLVGGKLVPPEEASYARGRRVAKAFKKLLGDRYYLEVQAFPELDNVCKINEMLERLSKELSIPLVATGDVHYTTPDENEMQQILHNIRGGNRQTLEEQSQAWGYDVPLAPPINDNVVYRRLRGTGLSHLAAQQAILSTEEIAGRCQATLPSLPLLRFPGGKPSPEIFKDWILEGWKYRGFDRLRGSERARYKKQLLYEMDIISQKDYIDYFLVVSDIVKFAKGVDIPVGPARGSAAASLVCYLLRITEVNPMLFPNLVFERFIDISRADLPDIDLDFDSNRRWEIEEYAAQKYGRSSVAKIGTFTQFRAKNSLDDVARVYRIPQFEVDKVKELLLERSSGDLRASATIEDTVEMFDVAKDVFDRHPDLWKATRLEGNVKGEGVHAAGLIIANGPISEVTAVYQRKSAEELVRVVAVDKYDAERQNLLKIDILGLNTMSMISDAMGMLGMTVEDLYSIPLDDPVTLDGFSRNDVVGVFQFDGRAMRSVNGQLIPEDFREICDVNALARPGPLHSGATAEYIDVKHGRKPVDFIHPMLEQITESTHGQIVYQEQILRIVRELGGFDWTAAAYIRKIISKKLGEQEFNRQYSKFSEGAADHGIDPDIARKIWDRCVTAGAYAFNAAHCVSYGMLAWWTMWFKQHHPMEFYVATLRNMSEDKQVEYLKDAERHGLPAKAPHPTISGLTWTPGNGEILGGLMQVKGVGGKLAPKMIEFRKEHGKVTRWEDYLGLKGWGPSKLVAYKAMEQSDDPYGIHWLEWQIAGITKQIQNGELGPLPWPTHTTDDIPQTQGSDVEIIWLGQLVGLNLRDLFESHYSKTGEVLDPADVKDPDKREWVVGLGNDDTSELLTITWDRWRYRNFKRVIWKINKDTDLILVRGIKMGIQNRRALYVRQMWVLSTEDE